MNNQTNITSDERNLALLCHLSGFLFFIPFAGILVTLTVWLTKKNESSFLMQHGKEVLNFQISMTIYFIVASFLILLFIGLLILPVLGILYIILMILGAVKASNDELFKYPLSIPFIV
ncbi:MAG: DUF4870 domain-containing protein [Bacteroidales bacterium]|nr:DUF4870 domain-containing protein [Bacteroidales bacterium]